MLQDSLECALIIMINRPKPWLVVRPSGCKGLERDLGWGAVRRRVQGLGERMQDGRHS